MTKIYPEVYQGDDVRPPPYVKTIAFGATHGRVRWDAMQRGCTQKWFVYSPGRYRAVPWVCASLHAPRWA